MMQLGQVVVFFADKIFVYTPREKFAHGAGMDIVAWGSVFPLYTTFACISLIYSVIAPLISIFAALFFGMIYVAQKYSIMYVTRPELDHGGILYPRALNQTFTGIYFMQLCISGLFFGVRDENENQPCRFYGIIMIVTLVLTAIFQTTLNLCILPRLRKQSQNCQSSRDRGADFDLRKHLRLLCKRQNAWLPSYKHLWRYNLVEIPQHHSSDLWDKKWQAILDERHSLQIYPRMTNQSLYNSTIQTLELMAQRGRESNQVRRR